MVVKCQQVRRIRNVKGQKNKQELEMFKKREWNNIKNCYCNRDSEDISQSQSSQSRGESATVRSII